MRLWNKIKDIDLLYQEQLILQCHATYFLSLTQQNHCIRISAFFKVKKEQATEAKFHPPSPSNVLFFMLFLTCYQTLNLTKKPQCIKVLKFWEIANAFFEILQDGAKHLEGYLGLVTPFDFFAPVLTCATGSDIFSTNHMFPNPVVPFTYPPTSLSLKLKNSFPENVFLEGSTFQLYRSAHVHSWQFLEWTCFNDASIRLDTWVHRYKKSQRRGFVECPAFWTKKRNRPAKTLSRRSTLCSDHPFFPTTQFSRPRLTFRENSLKSFPATTKIFIT